MKTHFEFYSGVTQDDILNFLKEKGIEGEWVDKELNIFSMHPSWTMKEWLLLQNLCEGFDIRGVQVRGTIMVPPPPELKRCE